MMAGADFETEIMHRLQNSVLQESSLLLDVVQYAAELDWSVHVSYLFSFIFEIYIF